MQLLNQLAPQYIENIKPCKIGLKKNFVSLQNAGNIVAIYFENVEIPSVAQMHHMIDMVQCHSFVPDGAIGLWCFSDLDL